MIKLLFEHPETKRLVFCSVIVERNIELLKLGKPIHVNCEDFKMKEIKFQEFMIMYYPDNQSAIDDLTAKGYITSRTRIEEVVKGVAH